MRDTPTTRDEAVRRLRRATSVSLAAAGALVAVFAGLAAKALPGHQTSAVVKTQTSTTKQQATAPPLIPAQSAATPAAPAAPPAQTQSPPVVVSGGT
jgi:hypothetical protein